MGNLENKILSLKTELDYNDTSTPIYLQLAKLIKLVIRAGEYSRGEKLPSERVMSENFSIARGTLRKTIDELLDQNIVVKKHGKGIFVSEAYVPRNIKMNVGLVYINNQFSVSHPMNAAHIEGINSVLEKYDYKIEFIGVDKKFDCEKFKKELKEKNINAIISFLTEESSNKNIEKLLSDIPFVNKLKYSNVAFIDFKKVMNMQFEYLYKLGHRHIAFNYCCMDSESTKLMVEEYDRLCNFYNLKSYKYECDEFSFESGKIINDILLNKNISAVIAADDYVAVGMLRYLYSENLKCPNDISIVGMGDYDFSKWCVPAITTIKMPYYEVGIQLGQSVINKISTNKLDLKLIERETVKRIF